MYEIIPNYPELLKDAREEIVNLRKEIASFRKTDILVRIDNAIKHPDYKKYETNSTPLTSWVNTDKLYS